MQRVQPFTTDSFLEFQFLGLACPQAVIHGGQEGVQDWPSHHALADTRALMAGNGQQTRRVQASFPSGGDDSMDTPHASECSPH